MVFLYDIGIRIYYCCILLAFPFNRKARLWIRGRIGLFRRISQQVNPDDSILWFHCSSLGEFEQGRPVMERMKSMRPDHKLLMTFFSPSGYEVRKDHPGADHVFYLPLDTRKNARRFIELIRPEQAYFVKYEYWFHYIDELSSRDIPVFLISAIFRPSQIFFKRQGTLFRYILESFRHIFVQDQASAELLSHIGINTCSVSGDTRFDRVARLADKPGSISGMGGFCRDSSVLIAGSTWPADEQLLVRYINNHASDAVRFIIAPHEIHHTSLDRLERSIDRHCIRFTRVHEAPAGTAWVLLVDTIGYLSSLYRYGHAAYIGGGFGKGIHNILEAAAFGIPVVFGPNYNRFREAREMIAEGAAFPIESYESMVSILDELLAQKPAARLAGTRARNYVSHNTGATERIVKEVLSYQNLY